MDSARIGFIGVGGIAGAHLNNHQKMEDVELVAICDLSEEALARRKETYHPTRTYTDFRKMLDTEELDAVYVCVPPFAHADIEEHVAAAGVALFVEKPVELHLEPAIRKYEAIRDAGILNAAGYCVRYMDTVDIVIDRLKGFAVEMALGYYMGRGGGGWWEQRAKSGGQLVEQTTHIVDLARYLVGDLTAVGGAFVTRTPRNDTGDIDNASLAHLYFENGAIGTIASACMLPQGHRTGLDLLANGLIVEYSYGGLRIRAEGDPEEFKPGNDMMATEDRAFIDAVKSGDGSSIRCDYGDAVQTLEVTLRAYEAFQQRTVLDITFRPNEA